MLRKGKMERNAYGTLFCSLSGLFWLVFGTSFIIKNNKRPNDHDNKNAVVTSTNELFSRRLNGIQSKDVRIVQRAAEVNRGSQAQTFPFRIIQTSPPHTGSTLMANIVMGLFDPDGNICFDNEWYDTEIPCPTTPVMKTHQDELDKLEEWMLSTPGTEDVFFITSTRDWMTLRFNGCERKNVLCIEYDEFVYKTEEEMEQKVHHVVTRIKDRFPYFANSIFDEETAVQRLKSMEAVAKEVAGASFMFWDKKYLIHGHHKHRAADPLENEMKENEEKRKEVL